MALMDEKPKMHEVLDGLFIGAKECASLSNLAQAEISAVLSIGCDDCSLEYDGKVTYLCFPDIMDRPESIILHIFQKTNDFISLALQNKRRVLVHCVYGQSRSASVVIAFLVWKGQTIDSALDLLKNKHYGICINPGFLGQLYVYSNRSRFHVVFAMICFQGGLQSSQGLQLQMCESRETSRAMRCGKCSCVLLFEEEYLSGRTAECLENELATFITRHMDSFWKGYRPLHKKGKDITPSEFEKTGFLVLPMYAHPHLYDRVKSSPFVFESDNCTALCSNCHTPCGRISESIALCQRYIIVQGISLHKQCLKGYK